MTHNFFTSSGKFFRGNLHTHSTQSDGILPPEEVCRRYQAEGYDFLAITDHFVGLFDYPITDTSNSRSEQFTTLLGAELHTGKTENGFLWHLVSVGLPSDFTPPHAPDFAAYSGTETAGAITKRAQDAGAFVAIAHPHWTGLTQADADAMSHADAVEVYNHGCYVDNDRGEGFVTLEYLLGKNHRLNMIATDDAHFSTPDHFGGWVMVKATENTPEALLKSLKAGEYYSSLGPEIHDIRVTADSIEVDCSAAATVLVQGNRPQGAKKHGESMTTATLPLTRLQDSPWLRVTVCDRAGKRAWSNPIWRDL